MKNDTGELPSNLGNKRNVLWGLLLGSLAGWEGRHPGSGCRAEWVGAESPPAGPGGLLILIFASIVSALMGEWTDAIIILAVIIGSTTLGFVQEYRASNAVEKLRSQVTIRSNLLCDPGKIVIGHITTPSQKRRRLSSSRY